jgi:hypothetical protein
MMKPPELSSASAMAWMFWSFISFLLVYASYNLKKASDKLGEIDSRVRKLEVTTAALKAKGELLCFKRGTEV